MIDAVAIDTDVLSFVFKGDTRADLYIPHLDGRLGVVSFMTLAELRQWPLVRNWGELRRRKLVEEAPSTVYRVRRACRIFSVAID